jgi:hypothetical protein
MRETKPPTRDSSSSNSSKDASAVAILILLAIGLGLYFYFRPEKDPAANRPTSTASQLPTKANSWPSLDQVKAKKNTGSAIEGDASKQNQANSNAKNKSTTAPTNNWFTDPTKIGSGLNSSEIGVKDFGLIAGEDLGPGGNSAKGESFVDKAFAKKNQEIIQSFGSIAHLNVPNIPGMQYSNLDLDHDIAGINLFDPLNQTQVSLLAKAGNVSADQLATYLAESDNGIPSLRGVTLPSQLGAPTTIPAPPGSGLSDTLAWTIPSGKSTVQIALIKRADGKGTYLAIIKADGNKIEAGEDYYERYYQQLSVKN